MKLKLSVFIVTLFVFAACKKDDDKKTYQVKYEVINNLSENSHIKITYNKNNNSNVVDGPLMAGQTWSATHTGNSGEQTLLSGVVVNDSANFDLKIIVDQAVFMQDNGYCPNYCDSVEVLISCTFPW